MIFPLRDAVEPLMAFASEAGLWQPEAVSLSNHGMVGKANLKCCRIQAL